jgi:deoxyhypusine synthase
MKQANGAKMMVTLAGAMSTAEIERFCRNDCQDKVQIISCTGANLEEDIMNLVAHSHYERVPNYRDLTQNKNGIYLKEVKSSNRYLYS